MTKVRVDLALVVDIDDELIDTMSRRSFGLMLLACVAEDRFVQAKGYYPDLIGCDLRRLERHKASEAQETD